MFWRHNKQPSPQAMRLELEATIRRVDAKYGITEVRQYEEEPMIIDCHQYTVDGRSSGQYDAIQSFCEGFLL